jgi:hypothetical protein
MQNTGGPNLLPSELPVGVVVAFKKLNHESIQGP